MKILAFFVVLCAVTYAADVQPRTFGNSVDNLVGEALECVRRIMKKYEPLKMPDIFEQVVNDCDHNILMYMFRRLDAIISFELVKLNNFTFAYSQVVQGAGDDGNSITTYLTDVYVSYASDFTIDHIENNFVDLWAKYGFTFPSAHVDGKFKITGTFLGKRVKGTGHFSTDFFGLNVKFFIQNELLDARYLHIKSMTLDYYFRDMKVSENGLIMEGLTEEELERFISSQLPKIVKDFKTTVAEWLAALYKAKINEVIETKTIQELVDRLKEWVENNSDLAI